MGMMDLRSIIEGLLAKGYEGGYWDYKSDYPNTVEEKLHDIICMANNLENRDAYLIYGANDDGSICGESILDMICSQLRDLSYCWRIIKVGQKLIGM